MKIVKKCAFWDKGRGYLILISYYDIEESPVNINQLNKK